MGKTKTKWAQLCEDDHYYHICLLAHLQNRTGKHPPSETIDVIDWCSKCRYHQASRQTAEVCCIKSAAPLYKKCTFFQRTAEDQQVCA